MDIFNSQPKNFFVGGNNNFAPLKAIEELTKQNLPYPKIDNNLLSCYFDFMCQDGFLPSPALKKSSDVN